MPSKYIRKFFLLLDDKVFFFSFLGLLNNWASLWRECTKRNKKKGGNLGTTIFSPPPKFIWSNAHFDLVFILFSFHIILLTLFPLLMSALCWKLMRSFPPEGNHSGKPPCYLLNRYKRDGIHPSRIDVNCDIKKKKKEKKKKRSWYLHPNTCNQWGSNSHHWNMTKTMWTNDVSNR